MIRKEAVRTPDGVVTRVTFLLPAGLWAQSVHLVGDFNRWDPASHPFQRARDGGWRLAVDLADEGAYRFRYLVDGSTWLTDGASDGWPADGPTPDFVVHADAGRLAPDRRLTTPMATTPPMQSRRAATAAVTV